MYDWFTLANRLRNEGDALGLYPFTYTIEDMPNKGTTSIAADKAKLIRISLLGKDISAA
jgi:hypothetical protein